MPEEQKDPKVELELDVNDVIESLKDRIASDALELAKRDALINKLAADLRQSQEMIDQIGAPHAQPAAN